MSSLASSSGPPSRAAAVPVGGAAPVPRLCVPLDGAGRAGTGWSRGVRCEPPLEDRPGVALVALSQLLHVWLRAERPAGPTPGLKALTRAGSGGTALRAGKYTTPENVMTV